VLDVGDEVVGGGGLEPVRYRLTVAYDGTDFCGWQKQEPLQPVDDQGVAARAFSEGTPMMESTRAGRVALRTVQGVLEQAVRGVCREPGIELIGASRTDSGVHARGQVAAFTSRPDGRGMGWPGERGADRLLAALNSRLPGDVLVTGAERVRAGFDPIGDCVGKGYSYTFHVGRHRPLWDRQYVHHIWREGGLDVAAMNSAAQVLIGEHDYAAFAAAGHGRLTTVRTIYDLSVRDVGEHAGCEAGVRVRIDISGSGFLWNMVRIIAGTLLQVGIGQRTPGEVQGVLAGKERSAAGPTLPAMGLCLEWVRYGEA